MGADERSEDAGGCGGEREREARREGAGEGREERAGEGRGRAKGRAGERGRPSRRDEGAAEFTKIKWKYTVGTKFPRYYLTVVTNANHHLTNVKAIT